MNKNIIKKKSLRFGLIIVLLYVFASFLSSKYSVKFDELLALDGITAEAIYVLIVALGVVLLGLSTLPILPFAVSSWGPLLAALLTVIGWTVGSQLAFIIARRYGKKMVCKIVDDCDLYEWDKLLPKKNLFWSLVLARIFLPVDVISYMVGLASRMNGFLFMLSTIIGTSVFSFLFAYAAQVSAHIQFAVWLFLFLFLYIYRKRIGPLLYGLFKNLK